MKTRVPEERTPTPNRLDRQTSVRVGVRQRQDGSQGGSAGGSNCRYIRGSHSLSHEADPSRRTRRGCHGAEGGFLFPGNARDRGSPAGLASLSGARVVRASEQKGLAKETSESEWDEWPILDGAGSPRLQGRLWKTGVQRSMQGTRTSVIYTSASRQSC